MPAGLPCVVELLCALACLLFLIHRIPEVFDEAAFALFPDVDRGIRVSLVDGPALRAFPFLNPELHFRVYVTAHAAGLRGWKPFIDFHKDRTLLLEFPFKTVPEHAETVVMKVFPEMEAASHGAEVDIFDNNHVVFPLEAQGFLAYKIKPLVPDLHMAPLDLCKLVLIVFGSLLHA